MSEYDRRGFLAVTGGALASTLFGCASLATTTVRPVDGKVSLAIRDYPTLAGPGGWLKILPDGLTTSLYVLALDDGEYAVLSPVCTHLGCTVALEGSMLICPCHGSTYDREGRVLRGPAELPLTRIEAEVTSDGILEIDLGQVS